MAKGAEHSFIEHVHAREVLDSRGNPTVEVEVTAETAPNARRRAGSQAHAAGAAG